MAEPSARALAALEARRKKDLRWLDLPYQDDVRRAIEAYAEDARGRFENVCVLGIGGSALGNRALHSALNGPFHDLAPPSGVPRLFVLDNIDPELVAPFLETIDPAKTLFNVISKSGSTAETMSQFLILRARLIERLGERGHRANLVVTTDAEKGVMREIVRREGYAAFVVPDGVGGVHRGPTPIRAVGVTDQHSQVQLYVEGPFDKWHAARGRASGARRRDPRRLSGARGRRVPRRPLARRALRGRARRDADRPDRGRPAERHADARARRRARARAADLPVRALGRRDGGALRRRRLRPARRRGRQDRRVRLDGACRVRGAARGDRGRVARRAPGRLKRVDRPLPVRSRP